MNYFEFFEVRPAFFLDEALLRKRFIANSRQYHPDFHSDLSVEEQDRVNLLSTINNQGYKILSDWDLRMEHILQLHEQLTNQNETLSADFLMEMMEINEAIMDLQLDFDEEGLEKVKSDLTAYETELLESINPSLLAFDNQLFDQKTLENIKIFYLKRRYLLRIRQQLSKFASPS